MNKRLIYFFLIFSTLTGLSVALPTKLRYTLLSSLVSLDEPFIYYRLGDCYAKGIGVEPNLKKAEQCYQKAAKRNYAKAMYKLGHLYSHRHGIQKGQEVEPDFWRKIPLNYPEAIKWYTYAADLKFSQAAVRLGYLHRNGVGTPFDYQKSLSWYHKAAKAGDKKGQAWLGYFYSHGLERESLWENLLNCWNGIEKNYPKALKWYLKAAYQGFDTAQYMVGFMYSHGAINDYGKSLVFLKLPDIPLDYHKAVEWLTKAADQGHKIAHRKLGFLYAHGGYGLQKNPEKAFDWYMKGARKGDAVCMRKVAYSYEDGVGTQKDTQCAIEWYSKAVQYGDVFSQDLLDNKLAQEKASFFVNSRH